MLSRALVFAIVALALVGCANDANDTARNGCTGIGEGDRIETACMPSDGGWTCACQIDQHDGAVRNTTCTTATDPCPTLSQTNACCGGF